MMVHEATLMEWVEIILAKTNDGIDLTPEESLLVSGAQRGFLTLTGEANFKRLFDRIQAGFIKAVQPLESKEIVIHIQGGMVAAVFGHPCVNVEVIDLDILKVESEEAERQGLEKLAKSCTLFKQIY